MFATIVVVDDRAPLIQRGGDKEWQFTVRDARRLAHRLGRVKAFDWHSCSGTAGAAGRRCMGRCTERLRMRRNGSVSAVCLGMGTMIGYERIVTTIGERN
nr:hypothetical protein [uncultured Rhodopila sp.]